MKHFLLTVLILAGCSSGIDAKQTLAEARGNYQTKLVAEQKTFLEVLKPPAALFDLVEYASPLGNMPAYISKPSDKTKKHPAIIWIVGGFSNSIDDVPWAEMEEDNDQSASIFREMGIVTMYPSLRGGNENPGYLETFYGEVDDVIAAARFLATVDYVDPKRIYLGGHSTGGTLALLVAESTDVFRSVFALGPIDDTGGYGQGNVNFDVRDERERAFRAPVKWLHAIRNPTFVFEGSDGNVDSLFTMQRANDNERVHFYPLDGYNHFNIIAPVSRLVADKILKDSGDVPSIQFSLGEIMGALPSS